MRTTLLSTVALTGLTHAFQYGYNQVPIQRDPDELAASFPEPGDDVKLYAPAFTQPESVPDTFEEGTDGPTDEGTMDYFLRTLTQRNRFMTYRNAPFQSEEGRSFPYIYVSSSSTSNETNFNADEKKLRIWLQAAVHGNEPAGDQSLLAFLGKMDDEPEWAAEVLEKADLLVLPRYNPDGVFYFQRYLATNFDPNRDHIKLARQQTKDIKGLFTSFAPHVAVDMHEYSGTRKTGPNKDLTIAADALFSAAKNLNIDSKIRKLSEELFAKKMGEDQEEVGFRWAPYVTHGEAESEDEILLDEAGTDAKIGRNAMGLSQCVTILCETRGIGLADQHFKRRTASALQMALSIVQTAVDNAKQVYDTVEGGRKRFVESNDDIVLTDSRELKKVKYPMANVTDGEILQYPVTFASSTPVTANLTRSRPQAYIIPRGWSDLAARLKVSGLEVTELPHGYTGPVEALNVTSVSFEDSYYEGVIRATVETEVVQKDEIKLPPGSFWVSTKQVNAALAFVALEPENIDSYASFNIIALQKGDEYPVFRVVA